MNLLANTSQNIFKRRLSGMVSSMRLPPRDWMLQQPLPIPTGLPQPPKRAEYALSSDIQVHTFSSLSWLDKTLAARRRSRIASNRPLPANTETFVAHVTEYIVKPLDALFDAFRSPGYDKLEFKVDECIIEYKTAAKVTVHVTPLNWNMNLTIFILPSLNLETPPVITKELNPAKDILLVDFFSAVFLGKSAKNGCEKTCILSLELPLHYFIASFINMCLPDDYLGLDIERIASTYGALNNPDIPVPTDVELLHRCQSHEDFDRFELSCNLDAIKRFLRWKAAVRSTSPPPMQGMEARMTGTPIWFAPMYPRYELEQLPAVTLQHIQESQRETYPAFFDYFLKNPTPGPGITVSLDSELSPADGLGYARTFCCSLTGSSPLPVDVSVPERLIVKLFDDRWGKVPEPDLAGNNPLWWSQNFMTAHDMLSNERNTYLRLRHVWGSIVPWFYGAFMFELSDGRQLPGILLEYVESDPILIKNQSEDIQIKITQSARNAIRVLQCADVTQQDWSSRQIIIAKPTSRSSSPSPYCVLIDFSLASQGDCWHDVDRQDDYGQMADALMINEYESESDGVPLNLLLKHYEPREIWDRWATSRAMDMEKPWGPPGFLYG